MKIGSALFGCVSESRANQLNNSHVNPAFQGTLGYWSGDPAHNPANQSKDDRIAELERDNAAKAETIALREQNIRDLESERDELVEVMFSIVDHKGIAGTAAHTAMRDVLKRLGYDHSDDARED
jgi:hypothetical protein